MWIYLGIILFTAFQKLFFEVEYVLFLIVLAIIMGILFLIVWVVAAIQKSNIKHQMRMLIYHKQLELIYVKERRVLLSDTDFKKEQILFSNKISEVKNQWITVKLLLFSLHRN